VEIVDQVFTEVKGTVMKILEKRIAELYLLVVVLNETHQTVS
jgi:hypothetical protein